MCLDILGTSLFDAQFGPKRACVSIRTVVPRLQTPIGKFFGRELRESPEWAATVAERSNNHLLHPVGDELY
jgi:hypothetical protein